MKRMSAILALMLLIPTSGCATSDILFNIFGDYYSGGGTTDIEKRRHFDQQVEASQSQAAWE